MTSADSLPSSLRGEVQIPVGDVQLKGILEIPDPALGLVLFVHGSGSSRHSLRNQFVARVLQRFGLATLLFDLLTREEERADAVSGHLRFNIPFLVARLETATRWAAEEPRVSPLPIGYFGASTGAAAALLAAANPELKIAAVVSRGGRPDLAGDALERVHAPTLLIVGGADAPVIPLNKAACDRLRGVKRLEIVPHGTHLFEGPGALDVVADLAARWFTEHLRPFA
jgi:dienelactone hydrolase